MDVLKVAIVASIVSMVVAVVSAAYVAWENAESRNLALATGTLAAAILLYLIQLGFELRSSKESDWINTEYTIDRAVPYIRQWSYGFGPFGLAWRMGVETDARSWLAANNPVAFSHDRDKLTLDFSLFSLVSFLARHEFDWQLKKVTYKGKTSGMFMTFQPVSKDSECTGFDEADLTSRLRKAGNLFAGAPLSVISGRLRLPPKSDIGVSQNNLTIRTPICQIEFGAELSGAVSYMKLGTGGEAPQLPSGEPQLETRVVGFRVNTTYFAVRARHRDGLKYREWASRVVAGAREWFEN